MRRRRGGVPFLGRKKESGRAATYQGTNSEFSFLAERKAREEVGAVCFQALEGAGVDAFNIGLQTMWIRGVI